MQHTLAFSLMKRPHESLGLTLPIGRKMSHARQTIIVMVIATLSSLCVGVYIYTVNATASKGFALRSAEKRAEQLQERISVLEETAAHLQSIQVLQDKMRGMGYIAVDQVEYIDGRAGAMTALK